jgi:hypothetical protein
MQLAAATAERNAEHGARIAETIFSSLCDRQFQTFRRTYPQIQCRYEGRGFVGGSKDPNRGSFDKDRFQWCVPFRLDQVTKLLGQQVLIEYLNGKNQVTKMYPKVLRDVRPDSMTVADEEKEFQVLPSRVRGLWAFVDVPRQICLGNTVRILVEHRRGEEQVVTDIADGRYQVAFDEAHSYARSELEQLF